MGVLIYGKEGIWSHGQGGERQFQRNARLFHFVAVETIYYSDSTIR